MQDHFFRFPVAWLEKYRIAGNFRGREVSRIGEKYDIRGENLHGLLAFAMPKDGTWIRFAAVSETAVCLGPRVIEILQQAKGEV